jgi:hypothetical protein
LSSASGAGIIHLLQSSLRQTMLRRLHVWLAFLVSTVLALPQGWCCLVVSLGCCQPPPAGDCEAEAAPCCCCSRADEPAPKSCCPTDESESGQQSPAGKCTLCVAATFKPPVKQTDVDDLPVLAYLLPVPAGVSPSAVVVAESAPPHETGPPRHVLLCVWRC